MTTIYTRPYHSTERINYKDSAIGIQGKEMKTIKISAENLAS